MSSLLHEPDQGEQPWKRIEWLAIGTPAAALLLLLVFPGDLATKTHVILQGLCAQRPSHSLFLGSLSLPMDARMTGIYIGAATMILWLALSGRLHRTGRFSRTMLAILALCIGVMAVDGGNALLVDLEVPPLYSPANGLRLLTGLIAGSAIGVIVAHLLAISVWQHGGRRLAVVATPWELLPPLLIAGFFCGLAASGLGILHAPISLGLLLAVAITVWPLAFTMLALLCGNAWSIRRVQEMSGLAFWAHVATIAVIVLAALGRATLEILWPIPRLP